MLLAFAVTLSVVEVRHLPVSNDCLPNEEIPCVARDDSNDVISLRNLPSNRDRSPTLFRIRHRCFICERSYIIIR